jgi:ABC-type lipoprotein release transport system permease subunit
MIQLLKLAWRNMWRNWRRTAIAMVAIVLGVVLLLFMDGILKGSDQAMFGNAVRLYGGNVMVHAPGYRAKAARLPLLPITNPEQVIATAKAQPNVISAAPRINTAGMVTSKASTIPVQIFAIDPVAEAKTSLQAEFLSTGRFLQADDQDAVLIGKGLADRLNATVGDRINLLGRSKSETMRQRTMTIVGIYNLGLPEAERGMVFINLPEAQTLYNLRGQITEVSLTLQSIGQEKSLMPVLQAALPQNEVDSWETLKPELRQALDLKLSLTSVFGLVIVFIASIGILNMMMMAVFERTREMGVLAALGLKSRQIMGLFLLEGALIGLVGAIVGSLLSAGLLALLAQQGLDFSSASGMGEATALMGTKIYPSITLLDFVGRDVTVMMIAALAALYPAWLASRQEPATALHHV